MNLRCSPNHLSALASPVLRGVFLGLLMLVGPLAYGAVSLTLDATLTITQAANDGYPSCEIVTDSIGTSILIVTYFEAARESTTAVTVNLTTNAVSAPVTISTLTGVDYCLVASPTQAKVCYVIQQVNLKNGERFALVPHRITTAGGCNLAVQELSGVTCPPMIDAYDPFGGIILDRPGCCIPCGNNGAAIYAIDEGQLTLDLVRTVMYQGVQQVRGALARNLLYLNSGFIASLGGDLTSWTPMNACAIPDYIHKIVPSRYGLIYAAKCPEWGPKTKCGNLYLRVDGLETQVTDLDSDHTAMHSGVAIYGDRIYVAYNVERCNTADEWDAACGVFLAVYAMTNN